jgi:hypothetical protein
LNQTEAVCLSGPSHPISLTLGIDYFAQRTFQLVEVDLAAFGLRFWEEAQQLLPLLCGDVLGLQTQLTLVHLVLLTANASVS